MKLGHMLDGEVKLPGIGPVKKKVLVPIAAAAAGFIAWRYYLARKNGVGDDGTATDTDGEFTDDGTIPGTGGGDFGFGSDPGGGVVTDPGGGVVTDPGGGVVTDPGGGVVTDPGGGVVTDPGGGGVVTDPGGGVPDPGSYGFNGTTNSQWVQYAATQLSGSGTWSYQDVVSALGAYLASQPLSALQVQIVQASIAVAGNPPVGSFHLISGGNTAIVVAPTGLKVTGHTATSVSLSWNRVAGATSYRGYHNHSATNVGASSDTSMTIGGLTPKTSYTFHVRALPASGSLGPASSTVTVTTDAAPVKSTPAPTKPLPPKGAIVSAPKPKPPAAPGGTSYSSTKNSITGTCAHVAGATEYRIYHNGLSTYAGKSSSTTVTCGGLKANTSYTVHMRAVGPGGLGDASTNKSVKTKAK